MKQWVRGVAALCAMTVISACTAVVGDQPKDYDMPGPASALTEFTTDWQAGRTQDASAFTTDPAAAALLFARVAKDLDATGLAISTGPIERTSVDAARVTATMSWSLPVVGSWTYDTQWRWERRGSGDSARWLLDYSPAVIHPKLGPQQTVAVRAEVALDGPIVDRRDAQLISPVTVHSVVLLLDHIADLAATARRLAILLSDMAGNVTAESITAGVRAARQQGHESYTVINLRDDAFAPLEQQLLAMPAVTLPSSTKPLPPTPGFASQVLGSAIPVAKTMTQGVDGWRIVTVDVTGDELATLAEQSAQPGAKVTLTLAPNVQLAARAALDAVENPAVLVALQPSTGEILAVAQNAAADALGPISLTGRYPPGSIFKIVTASAAIDHGLITPTTSVGCPGAWTTHHRTIHNEGFALGTVTATTAFAHSCNTTFAMLGSKMPPDALPAAAKEYGIGLDFVVKGITTLTGAIQPGQTVLQRAENGFGQGTDLLTPFSAALMAATVANGTMPIPILIRGTTTRVDQAVRPRTPAVRRALPVMMRAVVTDGTAQTLTDAGTVYAKTGTAEYIGDDGEIHAHAWTVGYRGDLAFSVMIVDGDSSRHTNEIVDTFLNGLPTGLPADRK